jgi:hypothetical protein
MSESRRRTSDAGRLHAWVIVLALAFVAVAVQQSHRYQRMRSAAPMAVPLDGPTAYRNSVRAYELYCEAEDAPEPACSEARRVLRELSRRDCVSARAAFARLLDSGNGSGNAPGSGSRTVTHPLEPSFRAAIEQICPGEDPA